MRFDRTPVSSILRWRMWDDSLAMRFDRTLSRRLFAGDQIVQQISGDGRLIARAAGTRQFCRVLHLSFVQRVLGDSSGVALKLTIGLGTIQLFREVAPKFRLRTTCSNVFG